MNVPLFKYLYGLSDTDAKRAAKSASGQQNLSAENKMSGDPARRQPARMSRFPPLYNTSYASMNTSMSFGFNTPERSLRSSQSLVVVVSTSYRRGHSSVKRGSPMASTNTSMSCYRADASIIPSSRVGMVAIVTPKMRLVIVRGYCNVVNIIRRCQLVK